MIADVPGPHHDPLPGDIAVTAAAGAVSVDPRISIPVPGDVGLVGSDLDGTLLRSDLGLGELTRAAITATVDAGIEFVYVTGRPPRWMEPVVRLTGHRGFAVCANGALLVDLAEERLLRRDPIPRDLAHEVVAWLRAQFPGITFAIERVLDGAGRARDLAAFTTVGYEPGYDSPWARVAGVERADVHDLIDRGETIKLLGAPPPATGLDADGLLATVAGTFGHRLHLTHSGTREVFIEIMSGAVDKGVGLAEVAALRGVPQSRTVAVGDMPNDLAMLEWAATSYAVANAHAAVRAVADHVLPSNNDDGVGRLLRAILSTRAATHQGSR